MVKKERKIIRRNTVKVAQGHLYSPASFALFHAAAEAPAGMRRWDIAYSPL